MAQNCRVTGVVTTPAGEPVPGVNILVKDKHVGVSTNPDGSFEINKLSEGKDTLVISAIGFTTTEKEIILQKNHVLNLDIILDEDVVEMDEVIVATKSTSTELKIKGYSVEVIEGSKQKNFNTDINQMLKSIPGINLRETGGLGSGFKLSLNGLSGNQIRYFIDGIPMENFGSALSLNNYPVNLIEKLEIYKGVVPVALGADALGGAVNIVTGHWQKSFMDLAYSYGSFNTHRVAFNGQYADNEFGYFVKGSLFYNHSDNNYLMKNVPVYDLELGNYLGTTDIERFHDEYTSSMLNAEAGLFDKSFADKLSVKLIAAQGRKNYQHPDNNLIRVFGDFYNENESLLFAADYRKNFAGIDVKAWIVAGETEETVVDTGRRKYNWAGDFITRDEDDPKGEIMERRSYLELTDKILKSSIGAGYNFSDEHRIDLNFSQNYLERSGDDKVDEFNISYESPNSISKNLLSAAYTYSSENKKAEISVFGKQYWYSGEIISFDYEDNKIVTSPSLTKSGFGAAASYHFTDNILIKSSYEKAYRIPESFEILGDGIYVNPNPVLQPEKSDNVNLGVLLNGNYGNLEYSSEVNLFYRFSRDFIRFNPLGPFGEYENLNNVKSEGIEGGFSVVYDYDYSLTANVTYQNITDQTEFDEGLRNTNYDSRVPNVPYFFGNVRAGYIPSFLFPQRNFRIYWSCRYVHEFYLTWENLGDKSEKNIIPGQFTQDIQIEYSAFEGAYNFSFAVNNLFDRTVYDNFNIQKPGRSYSLKLRYFLN